MLEINKYHVSEKEYFEDVVEKLSAIKADGKIIIVGLCCKLGHHSDPMEKSPVFVYYAGDKNNNENILSWAKAISEINYVLPALRVKYLTATIEEKEFDEILEKPEVEIADLDFLNVIRKYKHAVSV